MLLLSHDRPETKSSTAAATDNPVSTVEFNVGGVADEGVFI